MLYDYYEKNMIEVGIDESGCGSFIFDLYVAAVILPHTDSNKLWADINDSKKLSSTRRKKLADYIKSVAIAYDICRISNKEIDKINILQARYKAYHNVLDNLNVRPNLILIDGNRFQSYTDKTGTQIQHICIIKGDTKYKSIAAASILAKVERDEAVLQIHKLYPMYGWDKNKGYGTKQHIDAINKYGVTEYHRLTYGICKNYI